MNEDARTIALVQIRNLVIPWINAKERELKERERKGDDPYWIERDRTIIKHVKNYMAELNAL